MKIIDIINEASFGTAPKRPARKGSRPARDSKKDDRETESKHLAERGKASRALCTSARPDSDLGASNLASCKSQGLRARDGDKSHLIGAGKNRKRVKVGGKKLRGKKYGGDLPDWS